MAVFDDATVDDVTALDGLVQLLRPDGTPSDDDVALTRRLIRAGDLMGIVVLDHIIVAENSYASLRERGDLSS